MNITLTNSFHNKEITLKNLKRLTNFAGKDAIEISETTYRKIQKTLCGSRECKCGINFGQKEYDIMSYPKELQTCVDYDQYFILLNK